MLFPERRFGLVNNSNNLFDYLFSDPVFNVNTTELEKGYLTVTAEHKNSNEKKDDEGHLIRQERYYGSAKRSFYVGDAVTKEDIQAKYDKGVLNVFVPKKDVKKLENKQTIEVK